MTGRKYGGKSAEERHVERLESLLDSCLDLVGEAGVASLTVAGVCERAGLSRRYFYEQFASIEELLDALMDRAVTTVTDLVFSPGTADGAQRARDRIERFVQVMSTDRRLARLILIETLGGGALASRRHDLVHRAVDNLLDDFVSPTVATTSGSTDRLRLAAYALSGAASELLVAWVEDNVTASETEIVDLLTDLFTHAASNGVH